MDKIQDFLDKVPDWITPLGYSLAVIMLIAAGIMMQMGNESSSKAKKMIANILIGLCIVFLATSIAMTFKTELE